MKLVPFGSTGVNVSQMCLGTMMFGYRANEAESKRILDAAIDSGVNFLDTAAVYSEGVTEEIMGRALTGKRDKAFIVTKVNVSTGPEYVDAISTSLDASLKRLQTDHVDTFLLHWPRPDMDPVAIMEQLNAVVQAGKTRFIGCSNFPAWLVAHFNAIAAKNGWAQLVNNQIPYNLIERGAEVEVLPQAVATPIAITCYRPLMAGVLAGKYDPDKSLPEGTRAEDDERLEAWLRGHDDGVRKLLSLAKTHNVPASHVTIAWLKEQPGVTCPIVGVSRLEQFEDAAKAFDFSLLAEEREELAAAFNSEVKEVSQSYGPLRRSHKLLAG